MPVNPSVRRLAYCFAIVSASGVALPGEGLAAQPGRMNPAAAPSGATWTSAEPDTQNCARSRRKFWQAGDGWVVKTITVCR